MKLRKLIGSLAPLAVVAGLALGGVAGSSALADPGDFATCNSPIPADPSWHACYDHKNYTGPANVRGTHSWSNFHWYASFYNGSGNLIATSSIQGPYTGTSYHADVIAPATTHEVIYVVHNNCGCGMNDQFWVK